jgi:hypothetical protein
MMIQGNMVALSLNQYLKKSKKKKKMKKTWKEKTKNSKNFKRRNTRKLKVWANLAKNRDADENIGNIKIKKTQPRIKAKSLRP